MPAADRSSQAFGAVGAAALRLQAQQKRATIGISVAAATVQDIFPDGNPYEPLPIDLFPGAADLEMARYTPTRSSGVTLPSKLEVLGNGEYKLMPLLNPVRLGNTVAGYHWSFVTFCKSAFGYTSKRSLWQLHIQPGILSKASARIWVFVLALIVFVVASFLYVWLSPSVNADNLNVGAGWPIGIIAILLVLLTLSNRRVSPIGVMSFCRSLGTPEVEELMFSYSWAVEAENVRTLAKSCWETGVGVWIDVVKLCPGDEIRPVVRTMVKNVYRVVIFLSPGAQCAHCLHVIGFFRFCFLFSVFCFSLVSCYVFCFLLCCLD